MASIFASWKQSLQLFKKDNLAHFINAIVSNISTVYPNWLLYGASSIISFNVMSSFLGDYMHFLSVTVLVMTLATFLIAYNAMLLYVMVHQALRHEPFSFFRYRHHMLYGVFSLMLITGVVFYLVYYNVVFVLKELVTHPISGEYVSQNKDLHDFYEAIFARPLFMVWDFVTLYAAFIFFSFLNKNASIDGLLKSVTSAAKFIVSNLPTLLIVYACVMTTFASLGIAIKPWIVQFPIAIPTILLIVFMPLLALMNGALYKQLIVHKH